MESPNAADLRSPIDAPVDTISSSNQTKQESTSNSTTIQEDNQNGNVKMEEDVKKELSYDERLKSIQNMWEVPYLCKYIKKFQPVLGLRPKSIDDFESALMDEAGEFWKQTFMRLVQLLVSLDSRSPQITPINWEKHLNNCLSHRRLQYWKDSPISTTNFSKLSLQDKIKLMRIVADFIVEEHADFHALVEADTDIDKWRMKPIGKDTKGALYWHVFTRLYKEEKLDSRIIYDMESDADISYSSSSSSEEEEEEEDTSDDEIESIESSESSVPKIQSGGRSTMNSLRRRSLDSTIGTKDSNNEIVDSKPSRNTRSRKSLESISSPRITDHSKNTTSQRSTRSSMSSLKQTQKQETEIESKNSTTRKMTRSASKEEVKSLKIDRSKELHHQKKLKRLEKLKKARKEQQKIEENSKPKITSPINVGRKTRNSMMRVLDDHSTDENSGVNKVESKKVDQNMEIDLTKESKINDKEEKMEEKSDDNQEEKNAEDQSDQESDQKIDDDSEDEDAGNWARSPPEWTLVCSTIQQWEDFLESIKDEKAKCLRALYNKIQDEVLPVVRQRQEALERANRRALILSSNPIKRSDRLIQKEKERIEAEQRLMEYRRQEKERKEEKKRQRAAARELRAQEAAAQAAKEEEERRILEEEKERIAKEKRAKQRAAASRVVEVYEPELPHSRPRRPRSASMNNSEDLYIKIRVTPALVSAYMALENGNENVMQAPKPKRHKAAPITSSNISSPERSSQRTSQRSSQSSHSNDYTSKSRKLSNLEEEALSILAPQNSEQQSSAPPAPTFWGYPPPANGPAINSYYQQSAFPPYFMVSPDGVPVNMANFPNLSAPANANAFATSSTPQNLQQQQLFLQQRLYEQQLYQAQLRQQMMVQQQMQFQQKQNQQLEGNETQQFSPN